MVLQRLFAVRPTQVAGQALYAASARQARQPGFYRDLGVADSGEGRFELYTLHVALILIRLKGRGAVAADTAQRLFDSYVRALDDALREMGVGDLSVGKKMRTLGEAFYGRVKAYEEALQALPDRTALEDLLARTVLEGGDASSAPTLAGYAARAAAGLAAQPLEDLLEGRVQWPRIDS